MIRLSDRAFLLSRVCLLAMAVHWAAAAATQRTQAIPLQAGWNAVFIEVEPVDTDPAVVFGGAPVEIVATYFADRSSVQFLRDPDEQSWTDSGWSTWYAPSRPDAFLSKLHAIQANRPYLIKASAAHTLNVTGEVKLPAVTWQPNSLNFVGCHVAVSAAPPFQQYFAGSAAHTGQRVYKLVSGRWQLVTNVSGEAVVAGAAYWVYCSGGSVFQGPLTVTIPYGDRLDFGGQAASQTVTIGNTNDASLEVTVEDLGQTLPMAYEVFDLNAGETRYPDLPATLDVGTVEAGKSTTLVLRVKRENFTSAEQSTVLRISADNGSVLFLAVTGKKTAE